MWSKVTEEGVHWTNPKEVSHPQAAVRYLKTRTMFIPWEAPERCKEVVAAWRFGDRMFLGKNDS